MAIQFLRGTSTQRAASSEILKPGQPFYETNTNQLYIGKDDSTTVASLLPIGTHLLSSNNTWTTAQNFLADIRVAKTTQLDGAVTMITDLTVGGNITANGYIIAPKGFRNNTLYQTLPSRSGELALTSDIPHLYRHIMGYTRSASGTGYTITYYDTSSEIMSVTEYLKNIFNESFFSSTYPLVPGIQGSYYFNGKAYNIGSAWVLEGNASYPDGFLCTCDPANSTSASSSIPIAMLDSSNAQGVYTYDSLQIF